LARRINIDHGRILHLAGPVEALALLLRRDGQNLPGYGRPASSNS
jgi:hypothetical protein